MFRLRFAPIFLFIPLLLAACSGSDRQVAEDAERPETTAVEAVPVERGEMVAHYSATAALQAEHAASVIAEMPGTVLTIEAEEGDHVLKGQVLARLDADRSKLTLRQNEAELDKLKNEVDRNTRLIDRKLIPATLFDQSESQFLAQRADTDLARMKVRKSEIRAPFDGVVTRRWIKRGQFMESNAVAFEMADFSELTTRLDIPEGDASALKVGQQVAIAVDALPGQAFAGRIERIAPVVDQASGTIAVTVAADNTSKRLRPGLFCRLDIAYDRIADATLLPKSALQGGRRDSTVFVVKDGKAKRAAVKLGRENGGVVQVLDGIEAGDMVVMAGQSGLSDGADVEIIGTRIASDVDPARVAAHQ
ncbi:MAG: efflux RND transporter periplasmic adaptor subunit [Dokdonella sp.]